MDNGQRKQPTWKRHVAGLLGALAGAAIGAALGFLLEWTLLPVYRVVKVAPHEGTGTRVFLFMGAYLFGVIGAIAGAFTALVVYIRRFEGKRP
jgi:hypothetical protein